MGQSSLQMWGCYFCAGYGLIVRSIWSLRWVSVRCLFCSLRNLHAQPHVPHPYPAVPRLPELPSPVIPVVLEIHRQHCRYGLTALTSLPETPPNVTPPNQHWASPASFLHPAHQMPPSSSVHIHKDTTYFWTTVQWWCTQLTDLAQFSFLTLLLLWTGNLFVLNQNFSLHAFDLKVPFYRSRERIALLSLNRAVNIQCLSVRYMCPFSVWVTTAGSGSLFVRGTWKKRVFVM